MHEGHCRHSIYTHWIYEYSGGQQFYTSVSYLVLLDCWLISREHSLLWEIQKIFTFSCFIPFIVFLPMSIWPFNMTLNTQTWQWIVRKNNPIWHLWLMNWRCFHSEIIHQRRTSHFIKWLRLSINYMYKYSKLRISRGESNHVYRENLFLKTSLHGCLSIVTILYSLLGN